MKKLYQEPKFEPKFYGQQDFVTMSVGDGWINDPFTQTNPFTQDDPFSQG